jgi:hypothetical protein
MWRTVSTDSPLAPPTLGSEKDIPPANTVATNRTAYISRKRITGSGILDAILSKKLFFSVFFILYHPNEGNGFLSLTAFDNITTGHFKSIPQLIG